MVYGYNNIHSDDEYGRCSRCGTELYDYDKAYYIEEEFVCMDCATNEEVDYFYAETMSEMFEDTFSI